MSTTERTGAVTLPLLPLSGGVFVPGMVATIVVDTPEVEAAVEAAQASDSQLVLVPRVDGRYSGVGVIGAIGGGDSGTSSVARRTADTERPEGSSRMLSSRTSSLNWRGLPVCI